jgi:hypothetical protein
MSKHNRPMTDAQRAKELRRANGGAFGNLLGTADEHLFTEGLNRATPVPEGKVVVRTVPEAPKVKPAWMTA